MSDTEKRVTFFGRGRVLVLRKSGESYRLMEEHEGRFCLERTVHTYTSSDKSSQMAATWYRLTLLNDKGHPKSPFRRPAVMETKRWSLDRLVSNHPELGSTLVFANASEIGQIELRIDSSENFWKGDSGTESVSSGLVQGDTRI